MKLERGVMALALESFHDAPICGQVRSIEPSELFYLNTHGRYYPITDESGAVVMYTREAYLQ